MRIEGNFNQTIPKGKKQIFNKPFRQKSVNSTNLKAKEAGGKKKKGKLGGKRIAPHPEHINRFVPGTNNPPCPPPV